MEESTNVDMSRAQDMLPQTMSQVLKQLEQEAKCIGFIVLAHPEPQRAGEIKLLR